MATRVVVFLVCSFFVFTYTINEANAGPSQVRKAWEQANKGQRAGAKAATTYYRFNHAARSGVRSYGPHRPKFNNYRDLQAEHAWVKRRPAFERRGIKNEKELKDFAVRIRRNHDDNFILRSAEKNKGAPTIVYGKRDPNGKKGIIVMDTPGDFKNGGTIYNVKDYSAEIKRLRLRSL